MGDGCCGIYCWNIRVPPGYECSVPLEDPDMEIVAETPSAGLGSSPLSDRVRHVVGIAAARFGELTPTGTGDSTLRMSPGGGSCRRVEVGGPDEDILYPKTSLQSFYSRRTECP